MRTATSQAALLDIASSVGRMTAGMFGPRAALAAHGSPGLQSLATAPANAEPVRTVTQMVQFDHATCRFRAFPGRYNGQGVGMAVNPGTGAAADATLRVSLYDAPVTSTPTWSAVWKYVVGLCAVALLAACAAYAYFHLAIRAHPRHYLAPAAPARIRAYRTERTLVHALHQGDHPSTRS
jgi:hypothetical protein